VRQIEMEVVAFKKAVGIEGEAFTSKATFFEGYSWKDLRCSGCNRHIGYVHRGLVGFSPGSCPDE
jgi:hypothetical protein